MFDEMPRRNLKPKRATTSSSSSSQTDCSTNPKRGGDGSIFGGIVDEILGDILLRLPRESLLSSRLVSTRWLIITDDHSFIRSYRSLHPPMLGFYFQRSDEDPPTFVPTARSPDLKETVYCVGPTLDFLPHQDSFRLVHSCGGWLLLDAPTKDYYCVCNPLKKEWVEIPHPPSAKRETPFLIGLTCSQENPSSFQVVRLVKPEQWLLTADPRMQNNDVEVETFSSETGGAWRISRPIYDHTFSWSWRVSLDSISLRVLNIQTLPVFAGGVLYWLNSQWQILAYNVKRSECALVELDIFDFICNFPTDTACLGKVEGRLCYSLVNTIHLSVWILTGDYPKLKWTLKHRIEWSPSLMSTILGYAPRRLVERSHPVLSETDLVEMRLYMSIIVRPIGFHCNDSNIMFISICNKEFSYHLQTQEFRDLSGRHTFWLIFPYEMAEPYIPVCGTTAKKCSSGQ